MSGAKKGPVEIVFDGPPEHRTGRFVEVEQDGESISFGVWRERTDNTWSLDLPKETRAAVGLADALTDARGYVASLEEKYGTTTGGQRFVRDLRRIDDALRKAGRIV